MYIKANGVSLRIQKLIIDHDSASDVLSTADFVFALLDEKNCDVVEALRRLGVTKETLKAEMTGKGKKKKRSAQMDAQTIANVKAELQDVEEDIAYDQQRRQDLIDELWDLEHPVDAETQAIEDAIDSQ